MRVRVRVRVRDLGMTLGSRFSPGTTWSQVKLETLELGAPAARKSCSLNSSSGRMVPPATTTLWAEDTISRNWGVG